MKLLRLSFDEMKKLGDTMWEEAMDIKFNAQKLAWYMRGGIDYIDILNMSQLEINNINQIIKDNLETTKKSKLPFI